MSRPMLSRSAFGRVRSVASPQRPHLTFTVGDVAFGVDASHARHVMIAGDATERSVRFFDEAYPVVDLRPRFGRPARDGAGHLVLIACGTRAALRVDDLRGLCRIDPGALAPLPAVYRGPERRWIAGLAADGDAVTVVLRTDALLEWIGAAS